MTDKINKDKVRSLPVSNDVYLMTKRKQSEFIEKTGEYVQLTEVSNMSIRYGINNIELDKDNRLTHKQVESSDK